MVAVIVLYALRSPLVKNQLGRENRPRHWGYCMSACLASGDIDDSPPRLIFLRDLCQPPQSNPAGTQAQACRIMQGRG